MQQNCFRSLKETKRTTFWALFWGPSKRGHLPPPFGGSEKGSKFRFFDGLGICNDADEVIWLIRSEGLCNRISKELVRKRSRFSHFQGLSLRVQNGV